MFEDALLDYSLRRTSVLRRIHYLLSVLAGVLVYAVGTHLLPSLLAPARVQALFITAAMAGALGSLYALMVCYVWADARARHWPVWPWLCVTLLLNLPGFLIYLVYSAQETGDWKRAAIPLAYVAESLLVGVLILVPLIYTQALPNQLLIIEIHIPPPPSPPPARPTGQQARPPAHRPNVQPFTAPATIPPVIAAITDPPEPPSATSNWVVGIPPGVGQANADTWSAAPWSTKPEPPPPPPHVAPKPQMVHLPSDLVAARAVFHPTPAYPPIAIASRIQGTVVLQAIIGRDGAIQNLKVLSGHPMLARAALDTVKTWRYQPTMLNSEPVEVLTEIDVIFNLGD